MSKLEELIQKYCPDGVEYVKLGEVFQVKNGYTPSKSDKSFWDNGTIPWFRLEDIRTNGRVLIDAIQHVTPSAIKKNGLFKAGSIIISTTATIGEYALIECDFLCNQQITCLTPISNKVNPKFYLHYGAIIGEWCRQNVNGAGLAIVPTSKLKDLLIPLPPLPVQEEIVRVLDTFTELQAELQAELQKRIQQYEYYKWSILESLSCPTKHITDIALIKARVGWQRLTTAEYLSSGDYYLITGTDFKNGQIDFGNCVFVSKERYEMDPNIIVGKGDILITKDGTLGKVAYLADELDKPTTLNSGVFRIHVTDEKVSPRFLFHYFTSKYFTDFVNSVKTGSTIPHLTQQGLVSLDIPIPSLEEQNRVVSTLDRFETLTNDLTTGLPAEIEKRRQQYEYYRDKLMTFKRI